MKRNDNGARPGEFTGASTGDIPSHHEEIVFGTGQGLRDQHEKIEEQKRRHRTFDVDYSTIGLLRVTVPNGMRPADFAGTKVLMGYDEYRRELDAIEYNDEELDKLRQRLAALLKHDGVLDKLDVFIPDLTGRGCRIVQINFASAKITVNQTTVCKLSQGVLCFARIAKGSRAPRGTELLR